MQIFRLYLLAIATVVVVVACDRMPLTSPTGSTISVSADRTVLPLNGQTTVRAVVTESGGTPVHNGTMVTFNPSIGSVIPVEAATVNGVATATFFAGTNSGTGFIHAFSGGARTGSGNASSGGVEVRIGAAAAGSIAVSASPNSVSQSGGTVTVAALVMDSANNPLPGVSVIFTTSNGSLNPTQAVSDSSGVARTLLTTQTTATVTAIAGSAKGETQVTVSAAPNVTITAPDTGTAGVPVPISVTFPAVGTTPARQIATLTVDFGDGTSETRHNVTGSVAFSHTYGRSGGYTITATATDVAGNTGIASDAITISAASLPTATISANPQSGTAPLNVTFTVSGSAGTNGAPVQSVRAFINGEQVFVSSGGQGTFAHRFTSAGNHVATVVVTDANGNEGRSQTTVVVQ